MCEDEMQILKGMPVGICKLEDVKASFRTSAPKTIVQTIAVKFDGTTEQVDRLIPGFNVNALSSLVSKYGNEDAKRAYLAALALKPDYTLARNNLAEVVAGETGQFAGNKLKREKGICDCLPVPRP